MNGAQRRDWLKTVSECSPEWRLDGLTAVLARLDEDVAGGTWEGGVCNRPEAKTVAVRYFGTNGDFEAWKRALSGISEVSAGVGAHPPAGGLPWLTIVWDAAAGRLERVGPGKILYKPCRYSRREIEDAAQAQVLADFDALCRIRDLVFQFSAGPGKPRPLGGWSLRLERPLAWPLFARLEMAASFAAESSRLSFFLLDRRVRELEFDGERIWAYFGE